MKVYRVSWINGPDGRVIESHRFTDRASAEAIVARKAQFIGEDELLVFEIVREDEDNG